MKHSEIFRKTEVAMREKCHACQNGLVGTIKNEHYNEYWEFYCDDEIPYEGLFYNEFYCPMCEKYFKESKYLRTIIKNLKTRRIANMVTHYRHNHITSWNKNWEKHGGHYMDSYPFGSYEVEKRKVNERAKRQIIRKCKEYLKYHDISKSNFLELDHNDDETLRLIDSKLDLG